MTITTFNEDNVAVLDAPNEAHIEERKGSVTLAELISEPRDAAMDRVKWIYDNLQLQSREITPIELEDGYTYNHRGISASVFFGDDFKQNMRDNLPEVYQLLSDTSIESFATAWVIAHATHVLECTNLENGEYSGNIEDLPVVNINQNEFSRWEILKMMFRGRNPLLYTDGRASEKVSHGTRFSSKSEEIGKGPLRITTQKVIDIESDSIDKSNSTKEQDQIEFTVSKYLSGFPECNFIDPLTIDEQGLTVRRSSGKSLFDQIYARDGVRDDPEQRTKILQSYQDLAFESANQMLRLNDSALPLSSKQKRFLQGLPIAKLCKKTSMPKGHIAKKYQTHRLSTELGLDLTEFGTPFEGIQRTITQAEKHSSIWQVDSSPNNKKEECYDGNKVEYSPIQRGLVTLFETIPSVHWRKNDPDLDKSMTDIVNDHFKGNRENGNFLSRNERDSLIKTVVNTWNLGSDEEVILDDDFWKTFHAESFYRATLNTSHSLNEARELYFGKNGVFDEGFANYALLLKNVTGYVRIACESASSLVSSGVLTEQDAKNLCTQVAEAADNKMDYNDPSIQRVNIGFNSFLSAFSYRDLQMPNLSKISPSLKKLIGIN